MEIKAQFLPGFCMIFLVKSWLPNKWLVSYLWEEAKHFAGKCEFAQDVSQNIQMSLMNSTQAFKRQPHKMVRHTQTIRWQKPTNCMSVFDHFVGLTLKKLIFFDPFHVIVLIFFNASQHSTALTFIPPEIIRKP